MHTRYSKIILVWSVGIFALLVAVNNITDYSSNYDFVAHIMKMNTIFPDGKLKYRAIDSPMIHHLVYAVIILIEAIVAVLCIFGGWRLLSNVNDEKKFNDSKSISTFGLTLGIFLRFFGFIVIGGEWFMMWQSERWNGTQGAFRITLILAVFLIYLNLPDYNDRE